MRIAALYGPLEIGSDYFRWVQASKMDQARPPILNPQQPHNLGDWFVTKVADRLLDFDELILIRKNATDQDWDCVNQTCDALVLKGGNFIQPDFLTKAYGIEVFKKIKIPIVMVGAGLQAPPGGRVSFTDEEVEILRYIHDSSACSSVRGVSTAEALASIGIKNVMVTGCPTIFWSRKPRMSVRAPHDGSVGFSFRQGLFSSDPNLYKAQFRAIEIVRNKFRSVTALLQGEEVLLQHYTQALQWNAEFIAELTTLPGTHLQKLQRKPLDPARLREEIHARFDEFSTPEFIDWFMRNLFFSYDILEYIREYVTKGMMIGCRLHSNLLSLAHETPTFFLTYDQRTQELVDLLSIPHCRLSDFNDGIDLFNQDWSLFEEKYAHYYQEMVRFLELNKLKHRMRDASKNGRIERPLAALVH